MTMKGRIGTKHYPFSGFDFDTTVFRGLFYVECSSSFHFFVIFGCGQW